MLESTCLRVQLKIGEQRKLRIFFKEKVKKNCLSCQQSWFSVTRKFCCFFSMIRAFRVFFLKKISKGLKSCFKFFFLIFDRLLHHLASPLHLRGVLKTNISPGRTRSYKLLNIQSQRHFLPGSLRFDYGRSVAQKYLNFSLLAAVRTK